MAGSGAETRMEESAKAAEKACNGELVFSSCLLVWEADDDDDDELQFSIIGLGFGLDGELNFGFKMGFERFVGIVRDIFVFPLVLCY